LKRIVSMTTIILVGVTSERPAKLEIPVPPIR